MRYKASRWDDDSRAHSLQHKSRKKSSDVMQRIRDFRHTGQRIKCCSNAFLRRAGTESNAAAKNLRHREGEPTEYLATIATLHSGADRSEGSRAF